MATVNTGIQLGKQCARFARESLVMVARDLPGRSSAQLYANMPLMAALQLLIGAPDSLLTASSSDPDSLSASGYCFDCFVGSRDGRPLAT